ncbi:Aldedh-domain-containing protein [Auricularia subglabra TFB-10046 SS5]|uniref:Aldedh-domain-containing protein n=1 Tax=Auricularia subglabra (strain TFB-10046 / SS5) TaxID=717982 RepID=J0WVJ3_AURST|nr:Aldedh-domain-containing protein [Auricularia subglabra TFB-10046 SS5]
MPANLFSSLLAPLYDDESALVYILTACVAAGIWLVVRRYEDARNRAILFDWPAPEAASPTWTGQTLTQPSLEAHLLNPVLLPSSSSRHGHSPTPSSTGGGGGGNSKHITCYDPATGMHIATVRADDAYEIGQKIGEAGAAQRTWRNTSFADRRRVIRSLQRWLLDNRELCARVAARDTGKTMVDAALGEVLTTLAKMDWLIKYGEYSLKPEKRHGNFILMHKTSWVYYEPLGVVAACVSWNYPLHNALSPIMAALFAGNAIVLKCSEHVAWSTAWFVGAVRTCIEACGHDPDVVQLVTCWPEEAPTLTTSPWIRHITFIGSEVVGRKVAEAACRNLTPVTLELGGKDAALIMPGTDLGRYISMWMRGVFQGAGQNCIGIERLLVHSSQHDALVRLFAERAQRLRLGSVLAPVMGDEDDTSYRPIVDMGSMISADRFSELEQIIRDAVEDGAELVAGGERWRHAYLEQGAYFQPTVLAGVGQGMEVAQQELFAPVALIMPYETLDEAVEIANGTRYGLGASVFGPDQDAALALARRLEAGMVSVNDFAVTYINQDLPFGGTKASGYGRFGGPEGLRGLTCPKAVVLDAFPRVVQTSIPRVVDYPIRSLVQSWEFLSGLMAFIYGLGWKERVRGLVRLALAGR